jgi:23S rRNA (uracil1939-C5)-methyltransferase
VPDGLIAADPIVRIAARGDGVSERGVAVPLAAPGDLLRPDGTVMPGPHRQVPPCRHFPECGGCTLQHVDDAAYAGFLRDRIVSALHAQGLDAPELRGAHLSPPRSRRRASLRAERVGKRVAIGFNEAASRRIVDMAECHILHPQLFALVAPLRALLGPMLAERRQAEIMMTLADQGVDLRLSGVDADGLPATDALTAFAGRNALARLAVDAGMGAETRWEPRSVSVTLGGAAVALPPGGFLQATADGEAALVAHVAEAVGEARTIADLFSGLGTFALPLAARARVLAAEGARDAILALKSAGAGHVVVDHRDLFRRPYTAAELSRFDAVVLDPPRAGAKEQAAELAAATCRHIAYVSCNPATFARDAAALVAAGWRLDWIAPVGQFRWSTHVELVAAFGRG